MKQEKIIIEVVGEQKAVIEQEAWNRWRGYLFDSDNVKLFPDSYEIKDDKIVAGTPIGTSKTDVRRGCFQELFGKDVHEILNFMGTPAQQKIKELLEICAGIVHPPKSNKQNKDYKKLLANVEQEYGAKNPQIVAGCSLYVILTMFDSAFDAFEHKPTKDMVAIPFLGTMFAAREAHDAIHRFHKFHHAFKNQPKSVAKKQKPKDIARDFLKVEGKNTCSWDDAIRIYEHFKTLGIKKPGVKTIYTWF